MLASFLLREQAHRSIFDRLGARQSLRYCTIVYALSVASTGAVLQWCSRGITADNSGNYSLKMISQSWIVFMFVAKSAFVQLLFSQHWSFLTSLLSENDDVSCTARWAPIIAGIASVAATAAGWLVAPLVAWLTRETSLVAKVAVHAKGTADATDGLTGLLFVAAIFLLVACYFSDLAYMIAEDSSFAHVLELESKQKQSEKSPRSQSLLQESLKLFQRTPILAALCVEVLLYQSVASFLSHLFVSSTKVAISQDQARATYTGKVRCDRMFEQFGFSLASDF